VTGMAGAHPDPVCARGRDADASGSFWRMGLFDFLRARDAYENVYDDQRPRHEITHELLAGAAGFEAMRMYEHHREREGIPEHHELAKELLMGFAAAEVDKHFERGNYGHLNRHEARRQAEQQAYHLWEQQYGRY
jgi:hypothetical protein